MKSFLCSFFGIMLIGPQVTYGAACATGSLPECSHYNGNMGSETVLVSNSPIDYTAQGASGVTYFVEVDLATGFNTHSVTVACCSPVDTGSGCARNSYGQGSTYFKVKCDVGYQLELSWDCEGNNCGSATITKNVDSNNNNDDDDNSGVRINAVNYLALILGLVVLY